MCRKVSWLLCYITRKKSSFLSVSSTKNACFRASFTYFQIYATKEQHSASFFTRVLLKNAMAIHLQDKSCDLLDTLLQVNKFGTIQLPQFQPCVLEFLPFEASRLSIGTSRKSGRQIS